MDGVNRFIGILKYNLKISVGWNYILTFFMSGLFIFIFNIKYYTNEDLVSVCEMYFGLLGVILFPALGNAERSEKMEQFLITQIPLPLIIFIRVVLASIFSYLCISLVFSYAQVNGASFNNTRCILGIGTAIILIGLFGMAVTDIFNDSRAGYIAALGYYLLEYRTRGNYTKSFFLFGVLENRERSLYGSIVLIILLLLINLIIIRRQTR